MKRFTTTAFMAVAALVPAFAANEIVPGSNFCFQLS
jgi:hypothetical protein